MLTEKEIDDYHESFSPYFFRRRLNNIVINNTISVPVLMLASSGRIIGLAKFYETTEAFIDHTKITRNSLYVENENIIKIPYEKIYKIVFDKPRQSWIFDTNIKDKNELYEYILTSQKLQYMDEIIQNILYQSTALFNRLPYNVYSFIGKMFEVNEILNNNLNQDDYQKYPITSAYAKNRNIDLYQAAREIKFKISCDLVTVSESESIQMEYANLLKKEKDIKNLPMIYQDFENKMWNYAKLGI